MRGLTTTQEYVQLQNDIKVIRFLKLFFKNHFFTSFFLGYGIPILVMGINGGYFPAMCRICFILSINLTSYLTEGSGR